MPGPKQSRRLERVADASAIAATRSTSLVAPLRPSSGERTRESVPLDPTLATGFGSQFGHDFSQVRIHAERDAGPPGARAWTLDQDIFFAPGEYVPQSEPGQLLLAHELAHVVQQAQRSTPFVQAKEGGGTTAPEVDRLDDILPKDVGLVGAIDRTLMLRDVFGAELDALVAAVRTDAAAKAFTRKNGVPGLLALVDTRGAKGFDPAAAEKALQADLKRDQAKQFYRRTQLEARPEAPKSYWFGKPPERQAGEDEIGGSARRSQEAAVDRTLLSVKSASGLTVQLRFAFLRSDLDKDGIPRGAAKRARDFTVDAIRKVLQDLESLPPAPNIQSRREDEKTRARLKETLRGVGTNPLNVFIATSEIEGFLGLSLRTDQVYVRPEDIGDPSKLEAAVRVPLIALTGGDVPMKGRIPPLSAAESAEGLLHERLHALLIERGASANAVWETLRGKVVEGPPTVKNRGEEVVHLFLLAQEEVFVYGGVEMLGAEYTFGTKYKPAYELYVLAAEAFFTSKGAEFEAVTRKLDVAEKVAHKKLDWSMSFRHPKKVTLSGADLTPLNDLVALYPR